MEEKSMTIGCDVDGVLANWAMEFAKFFPQYDIPVDSPDFPPVWNWPEHYGATQEEVANAWRKANDSPTWWLRLAPMPDGIDTINQLGGLNVLGHNVYFITKRHGNQVKSQTEQWLHNYGFCYHPTVILAKQEKQPIITALGCDIMIDDKQENLYRLPHNTTKFLIDAPYNQGNLWDPEIKRVKTVREALSMS
jgi:5'(3')-deoxyribonucleotidase